MSALGSSVINKSGKKFAPKAPVRRPPAPSSAQTSARTSVDRQILSQTPQPQSERQHVAASPTPPISYPTPAPSQQQIIAKRTSNYDDSPTLISTPVTRKSQPETLRPAAEKPPAQINPRKRTAEPPDTASIPAPVGNPSTTEHTRDVGRLPGVAAVGTVAQENLSTPTVHTPGPPAITPNSTSSSAAAASTGALQANVNPPATKRRRVEEPQTKNSSTQSSTPRVNANVPRSTTETDAVVLEPSIRSKPDKAKKPTKSKVSAKARGKQRADVATAPNDADATQTTSGPANAATQPPKAKRSRKPAKGKGRQTAEEAAAEVVANATQGTPGKKRNARSRRKRSPTPEEAATETIIASEVKMADLCKDMRKGKKSKRERELQSMEEAEIAKKRQKELHDLLATEEPEAPDSNPQETADERLERLATAGTRAQPETILVDGEITIDYNTMQIDRHANAAVERRAEQQESVDETDLSRRVNAGSYMKVERSGSWNEDETNKFYDGLGMFGTDFEMISKLFPGRSRRSIKLKFCKEEKADYQRIKETLMGERIPVDIDEFSRATNTVFDDPKELEREMEEDRRALEQDMAAEKEVMQEAVRKRAEEARIEGEAVEGEGGTKENVGKAKKGKREKAETIRKGKRGKAPHAGGEVVLGTIEEGVVQGQGQVEVEVGA